jgi:hypothetical protein
MAPLEREQNSRVIGPVIAEETTYRAVVAGPPVRELLKSRPVFRVCLIKSALSRCMLSLYVAALYQCVNGENWVRSTARVSGQPRMRPRYFGFRLFAGASTGPVAAMSHTFRILTPQTAESARIRDLGRAEVNSASVLATQRPRLDLALGSVSTLPP